MTRTRLTLLLLIGINILLNSGCEKVVEKSELNFRDDRYYYVNSETLYTGKIVTYYENGQLESSGNYKDGQSSEWDTYYENGQLKESGSIKDNLTQSKSYYKNGLLQYTYFSDDETGEMRITKPGLPTSLAEPQ
jgi:antitoxin component YwqK of YwqJK toxin-antitoxin module